MNFNEEQSRLINSDARTILALAGAGCGKTATIIGRICHLTNDLNVDPSSILALTFTNAAAFEMGQRYKLANIDSNGRVPEFRTFHGFCYSLVVKDRAVREALGYIKIPQICDDAKLKEVKGRAIAQCNCKLSEAQIKGDVALTKSQKQELEIYNKTVARLLRQDNLITFDILSKEVCGLFKTNASCTDKYKTKYKHVYVDEFQDTDATQFNFVSSFPATTSIFLVGDALQAIYGWRGADNTFIKMLSEDPNWEVIKMNKNYRSTNKICDYANRFSARYASPSYRVEMEAQKTSDESVEVLECSNTWSSAVDPDTLFTLVRRMKTNQDEVAILCRTNKEVKEICEEFKTSDIPFVTSTKTSEAGFILRAVLNNKYMLDWLASFLDAKQYSDYIRSIEIEGESDIRHFLTIYGSVPQVRPRAKKIVDIRNMLNDGQLSSKEKFNKIVSKLKIKALCSLDESQTYSNSELVHSILDQYEEAEDSQIYVGTIHSSKGLEYDRVYVVGADAGMFKLDTEEMCNLFYVACTRAKNHLTVFKCFD